MQVEAKEFFMKKYYLLSVLFLLSACGGGTGGGNTNNNLVVDMYSRPASTGTPSKIKTANAAVTTMETFVNNSGEIIAAVRAAGINIAGTSSGRRTSSQQSIDLATDNFYSGTTYKTAAGHFKKMYEIANGATYTDEQLSNSYKLAGGTDSNADANTQLQFVKDNANSVLDKYFNTDSESGYDFNLPKFYTLEDVNFKMMDAQNLNAYFTFTLDDEGVIRNVDVVESSTNTIKMVRDNKTEKFENTSGYSATWNSMGNSKLSYSDFGYIDITDNNNVTKHNVFAGGYDAKKLELSELNNSVKYSGTAVATMYAKDTTGTNVDFENTKTFTTNNATLNVTSVSQTVTMPFSENGFYDVVVTKYVPGTNSGRADIEFKNFAANGDTHYQLLGETNIENFADGTNGFADMNFYGIKDISSEATGVVRYHETTNGDTISEREFQAAYGLAQTKTK